MEAGNAVERTERSCLSPSLNEQGPELETVTEEPVPARFLLTTSLDRKLERKIVAS